MVGLLLGLGFGELVAVGCRGCSIGVDGALLCVCLLGWLVFVYYGCCGIVSIVYF